MSLNRITLIGNVGQDPKLSATADGREIANLTLATSESWKDKQGQKQERVEWHRIVVFSQGLVGVIKNYVKKGSKLYIEGQLQTRGWGDKQGVKHYTTEIVLQNFNSTLLMLDSKRDDGQRKHDESFDSVLKSHDQSAIKKERDANAQFSEELDDDVPF